MKTIKLKMVVKWIDLLESVQQMSTYIVHTCNDFKTSTDYGNRLIQHYSSKLYLNVISDASIAV